MKRRGINRSTNDSSRFAISSNRLIRIAKEHVDILGMDSERRKRIYVFVCLISIGNNEEKCPFIRPPNVGVVDAAVCSEIKAPMEQEAETEARINPYCSLNTD